MEDLSSVPDEIVVERVLNGDVQAFEILVVRYQGFVASILSRHIPYQDVEDVAQDVFLAAFSSLDKIKNPELFGSWLRKIAVRSCVNYWRAIGKRKELVISDLGEDHVNVLERMLRLSQTYNDEKDVAVDEMEKLQEVLQWALGNLNPTDRMVVELVYFEDMKHGEVAELLGSTQGGVKIRLFRARMKLRAMIERELKRRGHGQKN